MRPDCLLIACVFAITTDFGCGKTPPASSGPAGTAPPRQISVVSPEKRTVKRVVEQPGTVQAFEETVLYPKIPGYVDFVSPDPNKAEGEPHDRLIDIGSRVKEGQVLAVLKVPELNDEMRQKKALVRQAEAEVVQAMKAQAAAAAGVEASKAQVVEARAGQGRAQALYDRWQSEVDRVNRQVNSGLLTSQTRDETLNQFKAAQASRAEAAAKVTSAEAAVVKAEADRDKAVSDVAAAEARLDVARAEVRRIRSLQKYLEIKAPFDGVVTRRAVNTGDYVASDGKAGLFAVARVDPVRVVVSVPEVDAGLVSVGQDVRISFQAIAGPPVVGKVVRTSWSLEPGSRTLRAEVDLPNKDGKLRPGMYVTASLTAELPAEWAVPTSAVGKVNDEPVIYLAENGKAVRVAVQLVRGDSEFTQVRAYRRPGASEWTAVTGQESVALPAADLSDGMELP